MLPDTIGQKGTTQSRYFHRTDAIKFVEVDFLIFVKDYCQTVLLLTHYQTDSPKQPVRCFDKGLQAVAIIQWIAVDLKKSYICLVISTAKRCS